MEIAERVGLNIKSMRMIRAMTLDKLSQRIEQLTGETITANTIGKYERGTILPGLDKLMLLAIGLDCNLTSLQEGIDPRREAQTEFREMRMLSGQSGDIMRWVSSEWEGDTDALITSFGLYAATPGEYRKFAMMELFQQMQRAIDAGAITWEEIPEPIRNGIPHVQVLLGGLYK